MSLQSLDVDNMFAKLTRFLRGLGFSMTHSFGEMIQQRQVHIRIQNIALWRDFWVEIF